MLCKGDNVTTAVRKLVPKKRSVQDIIQHTSAEEKRSWFDANGATPAPIAGTVEGGMQQIIPAMYAAFGAYGWQQSLTWYQLANMYVSWEYTATEKIARTLAALPAKLFRYENSQGKNVKPYYAKSLMFQMKDLQPNAKAHKLKKDHGIERIEIEDHPFLDLVNAPSPDMVRYNFWRMLMIHLELDGAVGIYKAKLDMFGHPTELHILPATWTGQFKPVPGNDGKALIRAFRLLDQDINTEFTKEEIIWMHYTSLRNPFEGMSALKAQLYSFNMDQYLMQQITAFYKNGAMFSNMFSTDQNLTQKQYNEIAGQLSNYTGAKNAGQKFILHSGLKVEKALTQNARDAMVDEIERMARDKMLSAHDLSAGKIGLTEHQNRSNLEVVDMGFFNEAIKPRAMLITEYFQPLVHSYDENLDFEFDYPHFQDRAQDIQERNTNLTTGVTTRNEERNKMGLEPMDGGDIILVSPLLVPLDSVGARPVQGTPTGQPKPGSQQGGVAPLEKPAVELPSQKGGPGSGPQGGHHEENFSHGNIQIRITHDETGKHVETMIRTQYGWEIISNSDPRAHDAFIALHNSHSKSFISPDTKQAIWKKFDAEATSYEPLFKKAFVKFLQETSARVINNLEKHGIKIKSNIASMNLNSKQQWLAEHKDRVSEILPDKADMIKSLKAAFKPVYSAVLQSAGKMQMASLKTIKADAEENLDFNLSDPRVVKWIGDRLDDTSETTAQTTIDAVRSKLRTDFEEGEPLLRMSEHLRDYFTGAETWRANEVARTEATAATGRGQLEGVVQMELPGMGKGWLIEDDPHTRDTHRAAAEQGIIDLDEDFVVGADKMQTPGTGDLAEESCNCRCGIYFTPMEAK
jgi:HK97 family phage portal protein